MAIPVALLAAGAGTAIKTLLKKFGFEAAKWAIQRAFFISLVVTLVPIAIMKAWSKINEIIINTINQQIADADIPSLAIQITGLGAWILNKLHFSQALAFFLSMLALKFTLGFFKR